MVFWVGLIVLALGATLVRVATQKGSDSLRSAGMVLVFLGLAALLFVLTINILVWTGRFGVAA